MNEGSLGWRWVFQAEGLELSISRLQNKIHFFIIAMPNKSHLAIFEIQNTKNTREFHLYCWDHVCKVNEWCLAEFPSRN